MITMTDLGVISGIRLRAGYVAPLAPFGRDPFWQMVPATFAVAFGSKNNSTCVSEVEHRHR